MRIEKLAEGANSLPRVSQLLVYMRINCKESPCEKGGLDENPREMDSVYLTKAWRREGRLDVNLSRHDAS